jgi:asparagine synthase (glutamine-hydrolysing)
MWLMARVIKSMGIKMVLSGEGADELFEGICISTPNAENFTKKMFVN